METPDDDRLDQSLRSKFEDFALPPSAPVWAGIAQRLPLPPPQLRLRRPWLVPLLLVLTVFVGGVGGWLLPHPAGRHGAVAPPQAVVVEGQNRSVNQNKQLPPQPEAPAAGAAPAAEPTASQHTANAGFEVSGQYPGGRPARLRAPRAQHPAVADVFATRAQSKPAAVGTLALALVAEAHQPPHRGKLPAGDLLGTAAAANTPSTLTVATATAAPIAAAAAAATLASASVAQPAEALPTTLRPLAALERQTLGQLPSIATLAAGPLEARRRAALLTALRGERAELFRLQRRTDSLLLALGEARPGTPAVAAQSDSARYATGVPPAATNRWSLLLTATPEQNTLALQGREGDSLTALRRNHETGRAGFSAALLAEYRLSPRLSVGGGVGYTAFGADLRITNKTTEVRVRYDTTTTHAINTYSSTHRTYAIRIVQVPQLSPVFNPNGQVIRYDTVYVPRRDTVFTTTVQHDTVRTSRTTVNPNISKKETLTSKLLQPNYRFFTVPVLLRYRLATPGTSRLWTDVAVGAQLQFFLGGTQVATDDGEHFRTARITIGSSPFRALNVALTGSLALNYALTPRLSVSVAPTMRWQALSLYKPETGLRQQATSTGLMFGVRFGL